MTANLITDIDLEILEPRRQFLVQLQRRVLLREQRMLEVLGLVIHLTEPEDVVLQDLLDLHGVDYTPDRLLP